MTLRIVPIDLAEANDFVFRLHRHNDPVPGAKFSIGVEDDGGLRGVAIVGRPVAPALQRNRFACEVRRVCTDGARNACSALYGAARRAARAMGFREIYTYTLPEEGGGESKGGRLSARQGGRRRSGAPLAQPTGAHRETSR